MQETSALYKEIFFSPNCSMETRLAIGESGSLIDNTGSYITFGGFRILVDSGGADTGFGHDIIESMETNGSVFAKRAPEVGDCPSAEIDIEMVKPVAVIPRMARLVPYVRLTDGKRYSEWIKKGVFWLDTRQDSSDSSIKLHGFDTMRKAEVDCPVDGLSWPARDIDVVSRIAAQMGTSVDSQTIGIMVHGYLIDMPLGYSSREVLGYIAASYSGCFVMNDAGQLRLLQLAGLTPDTSLLCTSDSTRYNITVGGVYIRV